MSQFFPVTISSDDIKTRQWQKCFLTKITFEPILKNRLKLPIYRYLRDQYENLFDKQDNCDKKVVVKFQEIMAELRIISSAEKINKICSEIFQNNECSAYIGKLIQLVITANCKILLLAAEVPRSFYETNQKYPLLFFQKLLRSIGETFFRDPFIFCREQQNGLKLRCINEILSNVEKCIDSTIDELAFFPDVLKYYQTALDNLHIELLANATTTIEQQQPQNLNDDTQQQINDNEVDELIENTHFDDNEFDGDDDDDEEINPEIIEKESREFATEKANEYDYNGRLLGEKKLPPNLTLITWKKDENTLEEEEDDDDNDAKNVKITKGDAKKVESLNENLQNV